MSITKFWEGVTTNICRQMLLEVSYSRPPMNPRLVISLFILMINLCRVYTSKASLTLSNFAIN